MVGRMIFYIRLKLDIIVGGKRKTDLIRLITLIDNLLGTHSTAGCRKEEQEHEASQGQESHGCKNGYEEGEEGRQRTIQDFDRQ